MHNNFSKDAHILITGGAGFIGRNLTAHLKAQGYTKLMMYDLSSTESELEEYAAKAKFVFHLAGVNRPVDVSEFYEGNSNFTSNLLNLLKKQASPPSVLITSSAQVGNGSDYGKSKEQAETCILAYAKETGTAVHIYRLPGVFGKWCRPNYNSVIATFCHNIANGLPIKMRDPAFSFPVIYIDDVLSCFMAALNGVPENDPANPNYRLHSPVYTISLGKLAYLLGNFKESRINLSVPNMADEFENKLYATYLSYLPEDEFSYPLKMNIDERGSFTEFLRTPERGQVSINVSKPQIVKGKHWHHTKNEKFLVVHGKALIRFRKVFESEVHEYFVSGNKLEVVDIPVGYTHTIENIGKEELVTVMWANEAFSPEKPDTYFEEV